MTRIFDRAEKGKSILYKHWQYDILFPDIGYLRRLEEKEEAIEQAYRAGFYMGTLYQKKRQGNEKRQSFPRH